MEQKSIYPINNIPVDIEECLYRFWYGTKYVIVKGKNLAGSVYLIQKGYAYFIAGGGGTGTGLLGKGHKEGDGKNTFYTKFYQYIRDNPQEEYLIEVILQSANGYQLLKAEQQELHRCIRDKNCLNSNVISYIPKYRKASKSYGWLSLAHVLNFKKYLKRI